MLGGDLCLDVLVMVNVPPGFKIENSVWVCGDKATTVLYCKFSID